MLVKWNKVDGVKKYKVAYRKVGSSKWTYKKTKKNRYTVRGRKNGAQIIELEASARSYRAEGLSRGSRYYVKVRPLKDRNGIRYIGILSKARRVKIK